MKNLAELGTSLQEKISTLFPNSYLQIRVDHNLSSRLTLKFSLEPDTEWKNGIFYNSHRFIILGVTCQNARWEKEREDGHLYNVDAITYFLPFRPRAKNKATLAQIEKHILGIFQMI